ncbi:MAG: hypothetical protein AABX89_03975 [Candidatus Thermoplasmatota archaeon]
MRIFVLATLLFVAAGCLDGPTRVPGLPDTCPTWTQGLGGPSVTTVINPKNPATWSTVDFSEGNATRPAVPLTTGPSLAREGAAALSQDRIELDFRWETKADGGKVPRGVVATGGELTLHFTEGDVAPGEGRRLPFHLIGLSEGSKTVRGADGKERAELVLFDEFTFRDASYANFTIHVLLDNENGSPDPAGAFALWRYAPILAEPTPPAYVYRAYGLYDRCEFA